MMIPYDAPGCYGSALSFQEEHTLCKRCPFREGCQPLHVENLELLRKKLGITSSKPVKKQSVHNSPKSGVSCLPRKTQELVNRLDKASLDVVANLRAGRNPFPATMPFLRIAAQLLLKLGRPVEKKMLSAAFMTKLDWAEDTADAHARMTVQALVHIGVVEDVDGAIRIKL